LIILLVFFFKKCFPRSN